MGAEGDRVRGRRWDALICTRILHSPLLELGLTAGDAAHNFRAALGHLGAALVEANRKTPGRSTQFPIYATQPNDLSKKRLQTNLARMDAESRQRIRDMQPYRDPEHPRSRMLTALAWIDNRDKRHTVTPTVALSEATEIRVTPVSRLKPPIWFHWRVLREPGTVLMRWRRNDPNVEAVEITRFDATIAFGDTKMGVTLRNLSQIGQGVFQIVESFEGISAA